MAAASPSRESGSGGPPDEKDNQRDDLMFKMYLAHELAMGGICGDDSVNPEDEFANPDPLYKAVKQQMHDAFWNIFSDEINRDPPVLSMAFSLIADIKESLFSVMTPNSVSIKNEVEEVLDVEHMKQQVEHNAMDVHKYAEFIIGVMSRICAPVRDDHLAKLKEETDTVKLFRGILEALDLMKLDLVKYALHSIKPEILNNKMEYERKKFNDLVEVENGVLPNTEIWLKKHLSDGSTVEDVVFSALCDILSWKQEDPYPETLFVDGPRLVLLKRDFYKLCVACSAVLLTFSCTPSCILDQDYKETLKSHTMILLNSVHNDETLKKILPNLIEQLKNDANAKMSEKEPSKNDLNEAQSQSFSEHISQMSDPNNKVRTLVFIRVSEYLLKSAKTPRDAVFPAALVLFRKEIENLNSRFAYIANFNMNICRDYYYKTIEKLRSE